MRKGKKEKRFAMAVEMKRPTNLKPKKSQTSEAMPE